MKKNNYFPMPNEIFCLGLNYGEIAVYAYLALAIDSYKPTSDIDVKKLQIGLKNQNIMIHFDDSLVPKDNFGAVGSHIKLLR